MKNVIVIGSGISGLATACRLRANGFDVTVLEANKYPGGKLTDFTINGYRFDAGPSLFTMPNLLDDVFAHVGKNPRDYYHYTTLAISGKYYFEDGTEITAWADKEKFANEIQDKLSVPGQCVLEYLKKSKHIYSTASHIFLEHSLHKSSTWLTKSVAKAIAEIPHLGLFETMHERNAHLLNDARLVQLFDRYATYNGSDPYRAPGILTSIPHLEFNIGAFMPEGGMHTITKALYKLACDVGVNFQFNASAEEIMIEKKKATGVRTKTKIIYADVVVSNMDVYHTYHRLLPNVAKPVRLLSQERSSSALIFYWGITKQFPELDLHTIFFAKDYRQEFVNLFQTKELYDDPTVYINITSKHCAGDAPPNCENWFVMINVPSQTNHDYTELTQLAKKNIINKLNRLLKTDLTQFIELEETLNPRLIELKTSSYQGSLYGTSSNGKFAAFLRHPNFSKTIKNLFLCGGSVHPGGGIPLCLQSAKITSQLISEQFPKDGVNMR
jgi:phytoene desaturase